LTAGFEPSRLAARDVLREVWLDIGSRPGRAALTALGTLIGIAVLVSTLGLAASLNAQIESRFDALTATELVVTGIDGERDGKGLIPDDAPARALRVEGVRAAAALGEVKNAGTVTGTPGHDPTSPQSALVPVFAASSGLADVVHARLRGRFFSDFHDRRAEPVAVLGSRAAEQLGITDVAHAPVVFVAGKPLVVVGIMDDVARRTVLLQAVVVPAGYASREFAQTGAESLIVETVTGGASVVGEQLGLALRPDRPDSLSVQVPPSPELTRRQISGDTQGLFIVLGVISLVIGGIGIANVTLVSVLERVPEIGLRRAVGARRRHVLAQFLVSSMVTGLIGAVLGAEIGAVTTVGVAAVQQWPPTMPLWVPALAPVLGVCVGFLAGLYPAYRASRTEPITALRTQA
jgi:ABC-type antimicrobial peptide transport system permease subunit